MIILLLIQYLIKAFGRNIELRVKLSYVQSNKVHNYVNIFRLMLGVTENGTVTAMKKERSIKC